MGASFLNAFTGIKGTVFKNSVAYLQSWVSRFKDDKTKDHLRRRQGLQSSQLYTKPALWNNEAHLAAVARAA